VGGLGREVRGRTGDVEHFSHVGLVHLVELVAQVHRELVQKRHEEEAVELGERARERGERARGESGWCG